MTNDDRTVDPALLSGYFISGGSAPLEEGRTVEWSFADAGGKLHRCAAGAGADGRMGRAPESE
jgi:hypothetical protein